MIRSKDSIIAHIADRLPLRSIRACVDSNLRICLLVATILSIPGITWGINECWNLDQMGHLKLGEDCYPRTTSSLPFTPMRTRFLFFQL
jgi:hypothetical protein